MIGHYPARPARAKRRVLPASAWRWARRRARAKWAYDHVLHVAELDDAPDQVHPRDVITVGHPIKWVCLDCPCGTGHRLEIPTGAQSPWTVKITSNGHVSLSPSIDHNTSQQRCHFILTANRVRWA